MPQIASIQSSSSLRHIATDEAEPVPDPRPRLVVAVNPEDVHRFPMMAMCGYTADSTSQAISLIDQWRPRLVAVDWDYPNCDAPTIVAAAQRISPDAGILVVTASPQHAPAALKAGSHAVLLKPLVTNLIAARLGRLLREQPAATAANLLGFPLQRRGTHQRCADVCCPECTSANAVCFDYAARRRAWFACTICDHTWLGKRKD